MKQHYRQKNGKVFLVQEEELSIDLDVEIAKLEKEIDRLADQVAILKEAKDARQV